MVIPKKNVSGNKYIYFPGDPLVSVCVAPSATNNMGQPVHPFPQYQAHCSDPTKITDLENKNVRGVISEFVTEVSADTANSAIPRDTPRTIKKAYSAIPSKQNFDDVVEKNRVELREPEKPLNLLKTPSYLVYSQNNDNRALVVPRELKQGRKLEDAKNIALKGQYDQITAQIHELKKRSPLPDPSERRN